jgi:acyl-CoA synthetase (AMP-forming)/AMP-acid ligase II
MHSIGNLSNEKVTTLLDKYCQEIPDKIAIVWLANGEDVSEEITYSDLSTSSKSIAANLIKLGCAGKIVALALRDTPSFIKSFFGCLYAGAIALPLPMGHGEKSRAHVTQIIKAANPLLIVSDCTDELKNNAFSSQLIDFNKLSLNINFTEPCITKDTVALLQYTSGSNSFPKGVVITHGNLSSTQEMIRQSFGHKQGLIGASWLPLYHDMGLIGGLMQPLMLGGQIILMPPFSFIKKPLRWLAVIDRYKVESSGAPNFAYDLCNRSIKKSDLYHLNLSSWQIAFCGAEPARLGILNKFSENLKIASFDPRALLVCYGLAEATLLVSATKPKEPISAFFKSQVAQKGLDINQEFTEYVNCGHAPEGCTIKILDLNTKGYAAEKTIGEILISGPNVAKGYLVDGQIIDLTQKIIDDVTWCVTGDLGFMDSNRLFITGRKKNLIKTYGRVVHAEDIEHKVGELLSSVQNVAALPFTRDNKETIILVLEINLLRDKFDKSQFNLSKISRDIGELFGLIPFDIIIVPQGSIPRTTSGKIQREKLLNLYVSNEIISLDALRQ